MGLIGLTSSQTSLTVTLELGCNETIKDQRSFLSSSIQAVHTHGGILITKFVKLKAN